MPRTKKPLVPKKVIDIELTDKRASSIPIQQVIRLRNLGYSYESIGKYFGVCKQSIHQLLQRHQEKTGVVVSNDQQLDIFNAEKGNILQSLQAKYIDKIHEKIDSTPVTELDLKTLQLGLAILYDKHRLETGKSTGNIDVILDSIADITKQKLKRNTASSQAIIDVGSD